MVGMKQAMLWVVALALCVPCRAVDSPPPVKILKVFHDSEPQKLESALERDISPNEAGKFRELREDLAPKPAGDYITVMWKNTSREPLPKLTVTLYFHQANRAEVQKDTVELDDTRRGTRFTKFRVIGDAYQQGGPVTAWKVEVASAGKPLDSFHSFLWKEPSPGADQVRDSKLGTRDTHEAAHGDTR